MKNILKKNDLSMQISKQILFHNISKILIGFLLVLTITACITPNSKVSILAFDNLLNTDKSTINIETNNKNNEVEHFFTHCLIVKPDKAFDENNFMAKDYDRDCLTYLEFEKILQCLYDKNYCLVNANDCFYVNENGKAIKKNVVLSDNKKPLILSIDDVNYDHKKIHKGMADKIAVDDNGNLCSIIDGQIDYEREFVSAIENFVKLHPDFSHNEAKAMLCLTGYDGILGYRTQTKDKDEVKAAKKVVNTLKQHGYYFACHSYGHYHMKKISTEKFAEEMELWTNEVEPIIGKTNIYVYPYGENQILDSDGNVSQKHKMLLDYGFKLFCGVGDKHFYSYYPFVTKNENQVLFMDRRPLDGYSLRSHQKTYSEFFDCSLIYDKKNRKIAI